MGNQSQNHTHTDENRVKLEGTVVRIRYCDPETLFTIAVLRTADKKEVTVVGNLAGILPHEDLCAIGTWKTNPKFGEQFQVEVFEKILPTDRDAIEEYLASGLIKGIGTVYAKRLMDAFGLEIFNVIENEPQKLLHVEGIGAKRHRQIVKSWDEHRALRRIIMFLQKHDISAVYAARIYRQYGNETIAQLERNPYQLALDIWGIGFNKADSIAMKLGIPVESLERVKAGVHYLLQKEAGNGNCFCQADNLIGMAVEMLGVEQPLILEGINGLAIDQHAILEILPDGTRAVYLPHLHRNESSVAKQIERLHKTPKRLPTIDFVEHCAQFEASQSFKLADNQRMAVEAAMKGGVLVITGGPGTGKTTIIKAILHIFESHGVSFMLAAPTGRAAKRMNETTFRFAATLHRLLKFTPAEGGYQMNASNPLKTDVVIVDEASMIDISLADALLRAVKSQSSVIFVGDSDQLPSVGPGNFLHDLMDSGVVPVMRLNEIFRQAQHSLIVTNAHKINRGEFPIIPPVENGELPKADFIMVEAKEPEYALAAIKKLVSVTLPQMFGYNPMEDIQVLSPMHSTMVGCRILNRELQQVLNHNTMAITRNGVPFRVGDKVMQMENNYDKDVFNGDIGRIVKITPEDQELAVDFDGQVVTYAATELDEIEPAYAITIHKSQGSEYQCVVIPILTAHYMMLQRNLIYTAITRGKRRVVLVGQKHALHMAINNISTKPRLSALGQRIRQLLPRL